MSPNHFVRLYVPGVEDLFAEGDRLVWIEHSGSRSRVISWRIWRNKTGGSQVDELQSTLNKEQKNPVDLDATALVGADGRPAEPMSVDT
ncbi:unnamed protein product [Sphagnum troendelagicum]|uniref:Uncharacterized protein n=1 Tax=Sphagnum troendelagicum TaxID=128251 RepID=A0ABP0ULI8_9BRYO